MRHNQRIMDSDREKLDALLSFDADCLEKAKKVLAMVSFLLTQHRKPTDIRCLAQTLESLQRVGRLALGASTINTQQVAPEFDIDATRERLYAAMLEAARKTKPSHADGKAAMQ